MIFDEKNRAEEKRGEQEEGSRSSNEWMQNEQGVCRTKVGL